MSMLLRAALAVAAVGALALPSPAAAPVPPGGQAVRLPFPAKAPVVVQLNGVGAARERLSAMLKAAMPDAAAALDKQIDDGLKQLLAGRALTAIPADGRVYLVVNDIAALFENTPSFSLLVPVTSYKEFRDSFLTADERKTFAAGKGVDEVKLSAFDSEQSVYMVDLKDYVALSPHKGTAEVYAGKFTRATTAAMPPALAKSFLAADLAVYANLEIINETFGEQIKNFKMLADFGLQQAEMGGEVPGVSKKQLAAGKQAIEGLFQAVEDCRGVVIAAEFRPEGLNVRVQAQFADDTASAKLLQAESPGPLADLGRLPAGLTSYAGWKFGKRFVQVTRGLMADAEFAPADDDEKGNAAVKKRQAELTAAGPRGEVAGVGREANSLTVTNYADPKKAVAALLGCYEAMAAGGRVKGAVLKDAPKVTAEAREHAGFTFAEVKLAFDFEATVKDLPDGAKETTLAQLKRTLSEQTTVWVGTDGKAVVQVIAKDWAAATAALDGYLDNKKSVGAVDGFKQARRQLPADATLLMMVNVGEVATMLLDTFRAMGDAMSNLPAIKKLKPLTGPPAFIGLAVALAGDTATADVFVPGAAIAAGRKIVVALLTKVE